MSNNLIILTPAEVAAALADTLTTQEAADLLGVSVFHVRNNLIKKGLLPAQLTRTEQGFTRWLISRGDVEALKARKRAGDPMFRPGPKEKARLTAVEKSRILAHFTRLKQADPAGFAVEMGEMEEES